MDLLSKYSEEIQEDVKFDQINILDKQLMLPAVKHKWVSRLIKTKQQKNQLEKKKTDIKNGVLKTIEQQGIPTGIPKSAISIKINASEEVKKINDEINDLELIIEYLEKVEKIFSSVTYDIGNATKLMVLETT
jgi:hypothetical protein